MTIPPFLQPDNLAGPRGRLLSERQQLLHLTSLIFPFMRRRNHQMNQSGKLRAAGVTVQTMIFDDFPFLRRTGAGQISHHHLPGGMNVMMIPIPI
ncbi:MAG TPA: hypothetical protein VIC84_17555, partial [Blastocatellia bacterium]